jgi:hypothetical protein
MSYAGADRAAVIGDLTAMEGEVITVAGSSVLAHFELGNDTQEASEYGDDNRTTTATATFNWTGTDFSFGDSVRARGRNWSITDIDKAGGNIITLTLEND